MMNEMASLMSKLDTQVAKAANKLASRAEELRSRLGQQVDSLVKEAQDLEKQAESNLVALASELKTKLDGLATEVQTSIVKEGMIAHQNVEEVGQAGLNQLEDEQTQLSMEVSRATESFRKDLAKLTSQVAGRLDNLIDSRNKELLALSDSILSQLKETHAMRTWLAFRKDSIASNNAWTRRPNQFPVHWIATCDPWWMR